MGRWVEMVCDRCGRRGPRREVKRSGWAKVERVARKLQWLTRIDTHSVCYLCPYCKHTPIIEKLA